MSCVSTWLPPEWSSESRSCDSSRSESGEPSTPKGRLTRCGPWELPVQATQAVGPHSTLVTPLLLSSGIASGTLHDVEDRSAKRPQRKTWLWSVMAIPCIPQKAAARTFCPSSPTTGVGTVQFPVTPFPRRPSAELPQVYSLPPLVSAMEPASRTSGSPVAPAKVSAGLGREGCNKGRHRTWLGPYFGRHKTPGRRRSHRNSTAPARGTGTARCDRDPACQSRHRPRKIRNRLVRRRVCAHHPFRMRRPQSPFAVGTPSPPWVYSHSHCTGRGNRVL